MSRFLSRLSVLFCENHRGIFMDAWFKPYINKQADWREGGRDGGSAALDQDNTHATQHTQMYMRYKRSGKKPNELSVSDDFFLFFSIKVLMSLLELVRTHPPDVDTLRGLKIKACTFFCHKSTTHSPKHGATTGSSLRVWCGSRPPSATRWWNSEEVSTGDGWALVHQLSYWQHPEPGIFFSLGFNPFQQRVSFSWMKHIYQIQLDIYIISEDVPLESWMKNKDLTLKGFQWLKK